MAQSRVSGADRPGASAPAPPTSAPGTSCSSAGSTTRSCVAGAEPHARPRPARVQHRQGAGRGRRAAEEDGHAPTSARPPPAPSSGGRGTGDDLDSHADALGRAARGHDDADFQARWNIEDCGPTRATTRYVEVDDGTGCKRDRRHDHQARRGQRHRRRPGAPRRRRRSTCRPTPARRSSCASATRPTAPRRAPTRRSTAGHLRRRHQGHLRRRDGVHATAPRPAPTAGRRRLLARRRDVDDRLRQLLHRVEPHVRRRTTSTCRPGPYNFGFAEPSRTGSSTSRTRTACWSPTGTPRSPTTTPASTPARARSCRSTRTRRRSTGSTAQPWRGAGADLRRAVRRWRRPTRSRCTPRTAGASYIRGQAAAAAVRRPREYWEPGAPAGRREGAARGVQIRVRQQSGHLDADPRAARSGGRSRLAVSGARCGGKSPPHRAAGPALTLARPRRGM